jgi:hypothetical protein
MLDNLKPSTDGCLPALFGRGNLERHAQIFWPKCRNSRGTILGIETLQRLWIHSKGPFCNDDKELIQ